jgi:hypothetical protein
MQSSGTRSSSPKPEDTPLEPLLTSGSAEIRISEETGGGMANSKPRPDKREKRDDLSLALIVVSFNLRRCSLAYFI